MSPVRAGPHRPTRKAVQAFSVSKLAAAGDTSCPFGGAPRTPSADGAVAGMSALPTWGAGKNGPREVTRFREARRRAQGPRRRPRSPDRPARPRPGVLLAAPEWAGETSVRRRGWDPGRAINTGSRLVAAAGRRCAPGLGVRSRTRGVGRSCCSCRAAESGRDVGRRRGWEAGWRAPGAARVPGALTPEAVASNFYVLRKLGVLVPGDLRLDSGAEASNVHTPHYPLPHLLSFIIVFIHL